MPKRILFLLPLSIYRGPSQRFRVGTFLQVLDEAGIEYEMKPFYGQKYENSIYENISTIKKAGIVFRGFAARLALLLFHAHKYDYVFVQKGAAPLGPPVFEWLLAKVLRKKIIFDFDDAIWIPSSSSENKLAAWFKAPWKVKYICKWAYKVVGGNKYLCEYARQYSDNVIQIPTCLDTDNQYNRVKEPKATDLRVGWSGSHTTLAYLEEVKPVIEELQQHYDFTFLVICNKPYQEVLPKLENIKWTPATETDDLLKLDIGLMPLRPDPWSKGKCGLKLLQYMSLGIPSIASPVGVNEEIISEGENAFSSSSKEEWKEKIIALLTDFDRRKNMGIKARETVVQEYSVKAYRQIFLDLFN